MTTQGGVEEKLVSGLCPYCNTRCEESKRSNDFSPFRRCSYRKLTKPPKVHSSTNRANRLHKPAFDPSTAHLPVSLYLLQYDPYPYNARPGQLLGVFSTVDAVTAAAFGHGAYTFSRDGLLHGTEYLNATGRIRIFPTQVQHHGVEVALPRLGRSSNSRRSRRSEPQATGQIPPRLENSQVKMVYLAIHQEPHAVSCVGLFAKKSRAWGSCLKNQALMACCHVLRNKSVSVDEHGLPHAVCRVVGSGSHQWYVGAYQVDQRAP